MPVFFTRLGRVAGLVAIALLGVSVSAAEAQQAGRNGRPDAAVRGAPDRAAPASQPPALAEDADAPEAKPTAPPATTARAEAPSTDARTADADAKDAKDDEDERDTDRDSGRATITIDLKPTAILEGHNLRATVKVQPDSDNRLLAVRIDAPTFYASTERELMGASSPRTYTFRWEKLPAGLYRVEAIVTDADGRLTRAFRDFQVHGGVMDSDVVPTPPRGRRRR